MFNSLLRFLKPGAKKISRIIKQPATQKILKSIGKEAASTGSELILEKIKGNKDIGSVLENRIQHAKRKITQSVDDAMKERKKKRKSASSKGGRTRYKEKNSGAERKHYQKRLSSCKTYDFKEK